MNKSCVGRACFFFHANVVKLFLCVALSSDLMTVVACCVNTGVRRWGRTPLLAVDTQFLLRVSVGSVEKELLPRVSVGAIALRRRDAPSRMRSYVLW